jgi:hypothetical protein
MPSGGLEKMGKAIFTVGINYDKAVHNSQLMKAKGAYQKEVADFSTSLDMDTDHATYEERFKKHMGEAERRIGEETTHFRAREAFKEYVSIETPVQNAKIRHRSHQDGARAMAGDLYLAVEEAIKREDVPFIEESIAQAREDGILDPVVAEKFRANALARVEKTTAWNDIINIESRSEVTAILSETDLPMSERNTLLSSWTREQSFKRAQAKVARDEAITRIQNDFVSRINELTPTEVQQSGLEPVGFGSKMFFLNLVEKKASAIEAEKNDPYLTTNPVVLAQLMTEGANPDIAPLSATEILSYVPIEDGLSIKDAGTLINTTDVRKTDIFKNTEAALKVQFGYEGVLAGFGSKQLGAIYYNNAMSEVLVSLAKTPLSGEALRLKIYEIAGPYLEQYMREYGDSQEQIDKKLKLLGIKASPMQKVVAPAEVDEKKRMRWIPGKGWEK